MLRVLSAGAMSLSARRESQPQSAALTENGDRVQELKILPTPMYGLIGKLTAAPGQRDALIAILLEGVRDMPGCLSYIIAKDAADEHGIWVTEVWDTEASHKASLSLPAVQDAIARGKPLIAGFSHHTVTVPVGGHGLK